MKKTILCNVDFFNILKKYIETSSNDAEQVKSASAMIPRIQFFGYEFIPKLKIPTGKFVVFGDHPMTNTTVSLEALEAIDVFANSLKKGEQMWARNALNEESYIFIQEIT